MFVPRRNRVMYAMMDGSGSLSLRRQMTLAPRRQRPVRRVPAVSNTLSLRQQHQIRTSFHDRVLCVLVASSTSSRMVPIAEWIFSISLILKRMPALLINNLVRHRQRCSLELARLLSLDNTRILVHWWLVRTRNWLCRQNSHCQLLGDLF